MKYSFNVKIAASTATLIVCAVILLPASEACAQERQMFGGVGIPNFEPTPEPAPRFSLPNLFSRNSNPSTTRPATPSINWPNLNPFKMADNSGAPRRGILDGLPRIFPAPDPNRPGLLEDWNQRSKSFFNRTSDGMTDWTRNKSHNFRTRTADAWNSLTNGLTPGRPMQNPPAPSAQPPVRSAELMNGQNRVRF